MKSPLAKILFYLVLFCFILYGCKKETALQNAEETIMYIPKGFPPLTIPIGNEFSLQRWQLGKRLFFDKKLSKSNTVSCASCHKQEFAFSDDVALSLGDNNEIGTSNAPTLTNIGYHPYYTRAGGVPTLEMQILVPIQEHNEFNTNILDIVDKLKQDNSYVAQAVDAYSRALDAFVITRALSNFERSMISGNSRFDAYYSKGNTKALSESEQRGYQLFTSSKTNCSVCHSDFNFTNYAFENNGLYLNYADSGRMRLTKMPEDRAKFKVPSLRNIALTSPYMHDGSMTTLEQVIEHYNSGGANHLNKSSLIKPLLLSPQEKTDIICFLKTLTDYSFIQNKNFQP